MTLKLSKTTPETIKVYYGYRTEHFVLLPYGLMELVKLNEYTLDSVNPCIEEAISFFNMVGCSYANESLSFYYWFASEEDKTKFQMKCL